MLKQTLGLIQDQDQVLVTVTVMTILLVMVVMINAPVVLILRNEIFIFNGPIRYQPEWFFRDNNSTGRYTIKDGSLCNGGIRRIRWSVIEPQQNYSSQLQFKFIDDKYKDIDGVGYRLNIATLTETQMVLKSNANVDGETVTIVYEFSKK